MDETITAIYLETDLEIGDLHSKSWELAKPVNVTQYWSGEPAPPGRHFTAHVLWTDSAFYVRFDTNQSEDLVIADHPDNSRKTIGLWERDVCEIFIAPENYDEYFEFEAAPTGEWLDLEIRYSNGKRDTDWDYQSRMEVATRMYDDRVLIAMKIPWAAFGRAPRTGDVWFGNLYRCVGQNESRGYLAWRPTLTPEPNFHVPERFGKVKFVSSME
jgi:hypothetical protein